MKKYILSLFLSGITFMSNCQTTERYLGIDLIDIENGIKDLDGFKVKLLENGFQVVEMNEDKTLKEIREYWQQENVLNDISKKNAVQLSKVNVDGKWFRNVISIYISRKVSNEFAENLMKEVKLKYEIKTVGKVYVRKGGKEYEEYEIKYSTKRNNITAKVDSNDYWVDFWFNLYYPKKK